MSKKNSQTDRSATQAQDQSADQVQLTPIQAAAAKQIAAANEAAKAIAEERANHELPSEGGVYVRHEQTGKLLRNADDTLYRHDLAEQDGQPAEAAPQTDASADAPRSLD